MTTRPSDKEIAELLRKAAQYVAKGQAEGVYAPTVAGAEGAERVYKALHDAADALASQPAEPTPEQIEQTAADLLSEDGENAEYDRAIVELVCRLTGRSPSDDYETVIAALRAALGEGR